jgi:hypothetical protein
MVTKHTDEKHPAEKHTHVVKASEPEPKVVVKYEAPPPKEGLVRVKMQKLTDEVNHGTTSYPVGPHGIVDLPPEAAAHVIRQGGAVQVDPPPPPPTESVIKVQHVADQDTILSYGQDVYAPDKDGNLSVPVAIFSEIEPHGFVAIPT